tara:strand:- start:844 stop:2571 length:1728 start_codon:yes stop_codon:yes gene_type:complete
VVKIRNRKRKVLTEKQQVNIAERMAVSTNIREELILALDSKVKGFRDIKWLSKSKTYSTIKDIKFNLCMIILNEYNGHKKKHNIDKTYSSYSAVNSRNILGGKADKLMSLVFDKIHPSTKDRPVDLIKDKATLKYKLKESIIQICDDVHLGEYKLHTRIARDGKKLNSLPQYVVRSISNGGLIKKNNTKKYDWNNIVQLNEDNILIGVKMWAELYRHKVGKKNDIGHWRNVLNSLREDYDNYSLSQLENRVKHSLELINKTTIDILGEGKILQIYQEKDSGRLYGDEWLNLQTLPREMRYMVMGGQNYYEYDMENAHYNIMLQFNSMIGGKWLDRIANYTAQTNETRERISKQINLPIGIVKEILITMIYGASINQYHTYDKQTKKNGDGAILKILLDYTEDNRDDALGLFEVVAENKEIRGLFTDIRTAKKNIEKNRIINLKKGKEYLLNTYNKETPILNKWGDKKTSGALLSHMMQGIEAALLMFVIEEEGNKFIMPHHDGWVSLIDWDTDTISQIIKMKSLRMMNAYNNIDGSFDIKITKKKINDIDKGQWAEDMLKIKRVDDLLNSKLPII